MRCLEQAVCFYMELGRLSIAARHYKVSLKFKINVSILNASNGGGCPKFVCGYGFSSRKCSRSSSKVKII